MGRRFGSAWNDLGAANALGAILTKDGQVATWNLDEFLATGKADVDRFLADLSRIAPPLRRTRAMDFGCGVGRITRALAAHFDEVTGVDVAESMIAQARQVNADIPACRFVLNLKRDLHAFPDESFDVVYCRLVLQHVRPEVARGYIPELVRVLARGGVLMFQLPEYIPALEREWAAFKKAPITDGWVKRHLPRSLVTLWRWIKFRLIVWGRKAGIDMFGMNRAEVLPLVQESGGRMLEVRPDASHGYTDIDSFEYWITK